MAGIGDVILRHRPHVVMFQEVTPLIYSLFRSSAWWRDMGFVCSVGEEEATRPYFSMLVSCSTCPFNVLRRSVRSSTFFSAPPHGDGTWLCMLGGGGRGDQTLLQRACKSPFLHPLAGTLAKRLGTGNPSSSTETFMEGCIYW
jgi:hypothetical protein